MKIKDLKANPRNPRKIKDNRKSDLKESMRAKGDLSGFVFNRRFKRMVGGHQRSSLLPADAEIVIEHRYKEPTEARTVAEGYVMVNGERWRYREVDADEQWEMEAMIAANGHGGEWDRDVLAMNLADFKLDINNIGLEIGELQAMNIDVKIELPQNVDQGGGEQNQYESLAEDVEQHESIPEHNVDAQEQQGEEESDEEYVARTQESTEQVPVEQIPSMVNTAGYDAVEEKTESKLVKHLVIIDCPSKDVKDSIRETLRADQFGEKHGVKIY